MAIEFGKDLMEEEERIVSTSTISADEAENVRFANPLSLRLTARPKSSILIA